MTDLSTVDLVDWTDGFCAGWDVGEQLGRAEGERAGYLAGLDAASRAVNNALAEVCQGIPYPAAEVVRRLVANWDRTA